MAHRHRGFDFDAEVVAAEVGAGVGAGGGDRHLSYNGRMKTISKRELNQHTAGVLDAVKDGRTVIVTERGVARWRIESMEASVDTVARLRAEGRITPAKAKPAPWPATKARYTPAQVNALFAESRGDR